MSKLSRKSREHVWPLALYVLLSLLLTYPLARQFCAAIPGDGFDGWQNYWNLWWMKIALLEQHRQPFHTDLLFHPTGVNLYFHTLNPLNGLLTLPIQLAWGLLPAYNTVVLLSFIVGGYGAHLLALHSLRGCRAWGFGVRGTGHPGSAGRNDGSTMVRAHQLPAVVAGLVYTFSPFHFAHLLGHMQVISLQWIPFYVLYLLRATGERKSDGPAHPRSTVRPRLHPLTRDVLLAAWFLILVGLSDWYYAFYCLLLTMLLLLYQAGRRRLLGRSVVAIVAIGLLFALAMSPILAPMLREARESVFMVPDVAQTRTFSADLLGFVTPQEFHPLWGQQASEWSSSFTSTTSERTVFAGFVPVFLAVLALSDLRRRRRGGFWLLSLMVFFVLSLGPVLHVGGRSDLLPGGREIPLPYALLHRVVPFLNISRSVSRFDVMVMLCLAVLAAIGLARLLEWTARVGVACPAAGGRSQWGGVALGLLCATAVIFEFFPAPYPMSPPDTPEWYRTLAEDPDDFSILNLPVSWDRPGYLLYQTVHQKKLAVAYISRNDPRTLVERAPVLQAFRHLGPDVIAHDLRQVAPSVFDYLDVRYVVVDRYKMPQGSQERETTASLVNEVFAGQLPEFEDERLTVFRVVLPDEPEPFLILGDGWQDRQVSAGVPWREIAPESTLVIHSPRAMSFRLLFRARAQVSNELTLWMGDTVLGGLTITGEPRSFESGRFAVREGDSVLRLQSAVDGDRVSLSHLELEVVPP